MPALPLLFPNGGYEAKGGGAGRPGSMDARPLVNETRVSIVRVMRGLDRPATAEGIQERVGDHIPLASVEYHLAALAAFRIVKPVFGGAELRFRLVSESEEAEIFQGAVPLALTEPKRTEPIRL